MRPLALSRPRLPPLNRLRSPHAAIDYPLTGPAHRGFPLLVGRRLDHAGQLGGALPTSSARTILIVDDEDSVRLAPSRQLTVLGRTVLETSNGVEALALVRLREGRVHLVPADVVMPRMNGTELAATLLVEFHDLSIILMSAYTPAGLTRVDIHRSLVPVLRKPFTIDTLAEVIQVALGSTPPPRSELSGLELK